MLAAHDSFCGGSLLPFHARKIIQIQNTKKKDKKKERERSQKIQKEKETKALEAKIEKEVREKIVKQLQEGTLEMNPTVQTVPTSPNVAQKENRYRDQNVIIRNRNTSGNTRAKLKAQDPSRVSLRFFLKNK